jgi:hypothetical protein
MLNSQWLRKCGWGSLPLGEEGPLTKDSLISFN